jgi:predicted nuclease with TOPRIM domain
MVPSLLNGGVDTGKITLFISTMDDPFKQDEPPKPTGRPPKPGKPPLFKDRRAHRIELRNKISGFKDEINDLKAFKTDDESKKAEIQQKMSVLKSRLKECEMEKESIEQFNHTQFVKNVEKSREDESRFDKESHGQTRFFENLKKDGEPEGTTLDSGWNCTEDDNKEATDALLEEAKPEEVPSPEPEVQSTEPPTKEEAPQKVETEVPLPQIEIPPNTIV